MEWVRLEPSSMTDPCRSCNRDARYRLMRDEEVTMEFCMPCARLSAELVGIELPAGPATVESNRR